MSKIDDQYLDTSGTKCVVTIKGFWLMFSSFVVHYQTVGTVSKFLIMGLCREGSHFYSRLKKIVRPACNVKLLLVIVKNTPQNTKTPQFSSTYQNQMFTLNLPIQVKNYRSYFNKKFDVDNLLLIERASTSDGSKRVSVSLSLSSLFIASPAKRHLWQKL